MKTVELRNGNKAVTLRQDKYGIELLTMRNGYQWTGMPVDAEILDMLRKALDEFQNETPNVELTGAARLYRAASSDRRERG